VAAASSSAQVTSGSALGVHTVSGSADAIPVPPTANPRASTAPAAAERTLREWAMDFSDIALNLSAFFTKTAIPAWTAFTSSADFQTLRPVGPKN